MMKRMPAILFILTSTFVRVDAADWPQFRGPDRNDVSKETGLLKSWPASGPSLLWTFRNAGCGYSSMAVVGERLYSLGGRGGREYLYAIDLKKPKEAWSVDVGELHKHPSGDGPCSTPTVDGELVYAIGSRGRMVCVKAGDGDVIWTKELMEELQGQGATYGYPESPLVDKDQVVATPGGSLGAIAAFDKKTGKLKWRCAECVDRACCASMIAVNVGGVRQYVQATESHLVGVRASDGRLLWRYRLVSANSQTAFAIIFRNACLCISASGGSKLLKLRPAGDAFEVEEIYRRGKLQDNYGGVVLIGEHLYGYCHHARAWTCQNFSTGKKVWAKKGQSDGMYDGVSVTFADERLYGCQYQTGNIHLIQPTPAGFKLQGGFRLPEKSRLREAWPTAGVYAHPVVANGRLYLRDQELIFCYDVRNP